MVNGLEIKIDEYDIRMSQENGVHPIILNLQHKFNPLHGVYCRMREKGINKKLSMTISKVYELSFYKPINESIGLYYKLKRNGNKSKINL